MRVIRHLRHTAPPLPAAVLTLGNFDGVHCGHQAIIRRAVREAEALGGQAVVLTFEPHPLAVLAPERAPPLIQPLHDRLAVFRDLGVGVTVLQRFTREFAALDPGAFVRGFLRPHLDLRHVVVGWDLTFGHDRAGTVTTLEALGAELGFAVDVVGPVTVDGVQVSSSTLRRLIEAGDMRTAARLLGRPYGVRGRVVVGEQRGRTLGFPTANLHVKPRLLLPPDGVYAVRAYADGQPRPGVMNVGIRPTFGERRRTIEVHLLDFAGDLYGRWLVADVVERLRGERKFAGPEALRQAIAADVAQARAVLAEAGGRP
jgi:riboflavin kinase/FMN adenylyltransferase